MLVAVLRAANLLIGCETQTAAPSTTPTPSPTPTLTPIPKSSPEEITTQHYERGVALAEEGKREEAIPTFSKATELDAEHIEAYL